MQGIYLVAMNKTVHHPLSMDPAPARHHRTFSTVTMLNLNGNLIIERLEIGMSFRIETPYSGLDLPCRSNSLTVWYRVVKSLIIA